MNRVACWFSSVALVVSLASAVTSLNLESGNLDRLNAQEAQPLPKSEKFVVLGEQAKGDKPVHFVKGKDAKGNVKTYYKGRKEPKHLAAMRAFDKAIHKDAISRLSHTTAAQFDCVANGWVCPVIDQGQCGSCWDFSGTECATSAFIKAGQFKNDGSFILSTQYTLDCYSNGGCDGDDNTTVLDHAKSVGLPTTADYGPYTASAGQCAYKSTMKLYKIADWGFVDTQTGVSDTQKVKDAMVAYGAIGCAVAADDSFSNYQPGQVFDSTTSTSIDHDVLLVGWDDTKGKAGAWKMQNSWSNTWGDKGYMWIGYGVNLIGTESVWATVGGPVPPIPPVPPSGIVVTVLNQNIAVGATAILNPTAITGGTLPYSFAYVYGDGCGDSTGQHTYKVAGTFQVNVTVTDSSTPPMTGTGMATVTVGSGPVPPIPPAPGAYTIITNVNNVITVTGPVPQGTSAIVPLNTTVGQILGLPMGKKDHK